MMSRPISANPMYPPSRRRSLHHRNLKTWTRYLIGSVSFEVGIPPDHSSRHIQNIDVEISMGDVVIRFAVATPPARSAT